MRLTRDKVEAMLRRGAESLAGHSEVRVRVGSSAGFDNEVTPEAVSAVYRDVKNCLFCKNRSVMMSAELVNVGKTGAQFVDGPNEEHTRVLLYGVCRVHATLAEKEPQIWAAKRRTMLERGMAKSMNEASRRS